MNRDRFDTDHTADPFWHFVAGWAVLAAVLTLVALAAPEPYDYTTTPGRPAQVEDVR